MPKELSIFVDRYIRAALWATLDENLRPLNKHYTAEDIAPESLKRMEKDCEEFQREAQVRGIDLSYHLNVSGHDFWLTRNRHGAGFWDGDYPANIGKVLTEIAHGFGESDLYVGDDGRLYVSR